MLKSEGCLKTGDYGIWSQYLTNETHSQILCVSLLASEVEDYSLCDYCYSLKKQGTVENEDCGDEATCLSLRWLSAICSY